MPNISNLIAATATHGERKPAGALLVGLFVLALVAGSAGAAFWIGSAISNPAAAQAQYADEEF